MSVARKAIFKILNLVGVPWMLRRGNTDRVTVLCFHRVTNEEDFFFQPIKPREFDRLLQYLLEHYSVVGFNDVHSKTSKPKVILSFDDGYYDFVENVLPMLTKYGIPCNLNLVNSCLNTNETIWTQRLNDIFNHLRNNSIKSDKLIETYSLSFEACGRDWMKYYLSFFKVLLNKRMGERNSILNDLINKYRPLQYYRMMNWNDAALCVQKGVEIGSHSYTHDSLKTLVEDKEIVMEVQKSIDELQSRLQVKVNVLALPNGQYNETVMDVCNRIGVNYVLASNNKRTPVASLKTKSALVGRVLLVSESTPEMILRSELFHGRHRSI